MKQKAMDSHLNTVPKLFWSLVEERGNEITLWRKRKGMWESLTWSQYGQWVKEIGNALLASELNPGDKVAILSQTRLEWTAADLGIICAGFVTAPIYQSNTSAQVKYIIEHSDSRLVFVEDQEQLDKLLEIWPDLPRVTQVVVFDSYKPQNLERVVDLTRFRESGRRFEEKNTEQLMDRTAAVQPDDVISFIYTSGTTGPPKAAMINSRNVIAIIKYLPEQLGLQSDDLTIAYLPLAHIAERDVGHFTKLIAGNQTVYAESMEDLPQNLIQTGPTVMFGTPRVFEKFYARITTTIQDATTFQKFIYHWALRVGQKRSHYLQQGEKIPLWHKGMIWIAQRLIFRKIHMLFGNRIRFMISGGAPISPDIIHYFHWVGLTIYEVYGLTETTGLISMNRPGGYRIGSVGRIFPDTEIKIMKDGEICARGPQMCSGYYNDPQATAELLKPDGDQGSWLHTGDVGYLDKDGYLNITDRKKDIMITAGGKNVAPQNIENLFKTSPYISQAMVYGDRKPFLTALFTLDEEEITKFARDRKILYRDLPDLSTKSDVYDLIRSVVREKNSQLASYESIKKFRILEKDFDQDKDEITPTLKVKRKVILSRYQDLLEGMYSE